MGAEEDLEAAAAAVVARQWPVTVTLKHPIVYAKESINTLVFQRGQMKVIKGMNTDRVPSLDQQLLIASRLCGVPVAALEMLDVDDCSEVIELALGFFAKCLGAGKTP